MESRTVHGVLALYNANALMRGLLTSAFHVVGTLCSGSVFEGVFGCV
jgi:hypothetical protein